MEKRKARAEEVLRDLASQYIARTSNGVSLITVMSVDVAPNFSRARILVSCFPPDREQEALHFLRRQRSDFRDYIKNKGAFPRIPFVEFDIDQGEKHRQRIDGLTQK